MTTAARYEARVDRSAGADACHPWLAGTSRGGYGYLWNEGRVVPAHRYGYELLVGDITPGLLVRHTCDNRRCQNPAHWLLGTHLQNQHDMVERGRSAGGERNGMAKLTPVMVRAIRQASASGVTHATLAASYAISSGHVSDIVHRRKWPELEEAR